MRRMTEAQLAEYEALCLQSGIDPQIDRLQRRVAIVQERRPPGPRDVPLGIWLRTIAAIVLTWTAGWLAIAWLAVDTRPGAQLAPIAVVLLVSTFVVVMYGYRRAWDRAFHAARMAPWPVLVLTAAVALGVLRAPDDGPAQQTADVPDARPTAAPWFAPGAGDGSSWGAQPTAEILPAPAQAANVVVPTLAPTIAPIPTVMPTAIAAPLVEAVTAANAPALPSCAASMARPGCVVVGAQDGAELAVQAAGAAQGVAAAVAPVVEKVIDVAQTTVDHAQAAGHTAERHQAPAAAGQAGSVAADTGAALAGAAADARQAARRTAEDAVAQPASVAAEVGARLACLLRGGCK